VNATRTAGATGLRAFPRLRTSHYGRIEVNCLGLPCLLPATCPFLKLPENAVTGQKSEITH
jgi:hypothetical protein